MKNRIIFSFALLLIFSCAEKLIEKPAKLIPQDKMVLIIKDMAVLNAAKSTNLSKLTDNGIDPTSYLFDKYEIDSAQFVDSDRYYASLPLVYETIYKDVEHILETEGKIVGDAKKLKDSLNLLKKEKDKKRVEALK